MTTLIILGIATVLGLWWLWRLASPHIKEDE